MPELPEVQAIVEQLGDRLPGRVIAAGHLIAFSALKTYSPGLEALAGLEISGVSRHGKFIDVDAQGIHLIFHLARAGWVTWHDEVPRTLPRPGKSPIALRVELDDNSGFSLTEAGTQRHLAVYVVEDPSAVPGIAALGPDPLDPAFTADTLAIILAAAGKSQVKGVLRDQKVISGIGNAWSDEILHEARLSPFKPANTVDAAQLYQHIHGVLSSALQAVRGVELNRLKDAKRGGLRVHGRAGETCDVCGSVIAEVSFADSSLQYCPGCQTGGKLLADRRLSKLLK
ncbi:Fpg/Nei family DNA glycosylase [Tessaracoccus antarcticus]|uniref:Fpg/Nei family DNA glycosylase n=1 Tax=Tessaracoccus antarcticus TaxID=2479848 RepID=A0A3M0GC72_9ACTN|nr:DNA-formamidopyrimidine glycosylase family protein [Tessaracoccus antarcticus]RMB62370.1 Fpg/Nei family DNA glycosylase [Tessaracoccus antarcticus]